MLQGVSLYARFIFLLILFFFSTQMTVLGAALPMWTIKGLTWNKFKIKGKPQKKNLGKRLEEFNEQKLTCIKSDLVLTWQMLSGAATGYVIRYKQRCVTFSLDGHFKTTYILFHFKHIYFM